MLNMNLEELESRFVEVKQWFDGFSRKSHYTKSKYETDLLLFCNLLEIDSLEKIKCLTNAQLNTYLNYSAENHWSNATFNGRIGNVKRFIKWLIFNDLVSNKVIKAFGMDKPSANNSEHHKPLSQEQVDLLFKAIDEHSTKQRMKVMVALALDSGFRRFEICNLKISDIGENKIKVIGKGNKIKYQPISPDVIELIQMYIITERKEVMDKYVKMGGKDLGYVFVSNIVDTAKHQEKELDNGNKVNEKAFYNQLKTFLRKAGIDEKQYGVHSLRATFGTTIYYKSNGDIKATQMLMRHKNSAVTLECYINANDEKIKETADKYTPFAIYNHSKVEERKTERELELERQNAELLRLLNAKMAVDSCKTINK